MKVKEKSGRNDIKSKRRKKNCTKVFTKIKTCALCFQTTEQ